MHDDSTTQPTPPLAEHPATPDASTDASTDAPAGGGVDAAAQVSPDLVKLALRRVKDPELHLNVVDLGLVYDIRVEGPAVTVDMSLTSPGCPSGPEILGDVEQQVKTVEGVESVTVNLVWSPMWSPERIEPRVRAYLGF